MTLLKVANVISGRGGIACSGEFELFLVLPGLEMKMWDSDPEPT